MEQQSDRQVGVAPRRVPGSLYRDFFLWPIPTRHPLATDAAVVQSGISDPSFLSRDARVLPVDFRLIAEAVDSDSGVWEGITLLWFPYTRLQAIGNRGMYDLGRLAFRATSPSVLWYLVEVRFSVSTGDWVFAVVDSSGRAFTSVSAIVAAAAAFIDWYHDTAYPATRSGSQNPRG